MRLAPAVLTALLAASLVGCAPPSVEQEVVEERVIDHVEEETGTRPDDALCPDEIRGEESNTMTCLVELGGQQYDVEVQVEDVTGDSADDVQLRYQLEDVEESPPAE